MSVNHDEVVPHSGESGWHRITDIDDFVKWAYKDGPYRVVAFLSNRGHWKVIFTTWYSPDSHLIRGNLGGGKTGELKAIASARQFMEKNNNGCPPPSEYAGNNG